MRIDQLLVQRGLASTRSQAQRLIADGVEWLNLDTWKRVAKNGDEVPESADIRLLDDSEARYVSRGGLKLEAALKKVGLSVDGFKCLDVGQSTGGFTDCLLKSGALSVVGLDVGSAQLHPSLRSDPRVLCVEGVNARTVSATNLIAADANYRPARGNQRCCLAKRSMLAQLVHCARTLGQMNWSSWRWKNVSNASVWTAGYPS